MPPGSLQEWSCQVVGTVGLWGAVFYISFADVEIQYTLLMTRLLNKIPFSHLSIC
jgi:hypothetical protein